MEISWPSFQRRNGEKKKYRDRWLGLRLVGSAVAVLLSPLAAGGQLSALHVC